MDRNCSNLSKLPPKLRYFNGIERSSSKQMTNNVVRNIEDLLDELDTESELSPLSKAGNLSEDGENVSIPKLILETSDDVLCNVQESLSEDCAPKKMSTPVPLVAGGDDPDWDGDENHRGSPVLLESEDELPESDAIKTAQSDKKSQLAGKDFEEKEASPAQVSPLEADEDFMILEEENLKSPRWFTIPRKTEVKRNKPEQQETSEAEVKNNKEASTSEKAANDIHNQAQNKKIKRSRSKGAKEKKTNELGNVEQKMKRRRVNSVDKRPVDIPDSAQSVSMSDSPERLAEVSGHAETQSDEHRDELLPLPSKTSNQAEEPDKKQKKSKGKQPNNGGGTDMPHSVQENGAPLEHHETGRRKRKKPGSWWLVNQDEQTDMCNNELHSSGTNRRKKANKTPPAPVLSPAAEDDVPLEGSRKRSKRVSNQSSGTMTQISKKKSQSTRHNQKSKKTVPEFPSLPEESEGNGNDFSGVDDGYSEPSPNPDQHYSPTPAAKRSPSRRPLNYPNTLPPQGDYSGVSKRSSAVFNGYQHGSDYPTNEPVANFVSTKAIADICPNCPRAVHGKHSGTVPLTMDSARIPQFDELQSEVDRCKGFESGPSSMIELEKWRQMCGPPLRPITLQVEDREDLVKWLSNVWTTPGHAYGMRNLTAEPAVLFYHRMVAEPSDLGD
ncbi:hypothetical protein JZ751_003771 [Albula glossodonta]|uniref:Uncharacterized protein n=1 Tax=Albula glossodonta TaxID=121402 RepID=A0A8T2PG43_9TELE|nr:hypothetical protein JZ751_003771 [Albula glossodonta]